MKRILLPFISALVVLLVFAGCNRTGSSDSSAGTPPVSSAPEASEETPSAVPEDISLDEIFDAIAAAYGDDYPVNSEIPAEMLETEFGLDSGLYEEARGEMAMISVHNDRVVVAKAAPGKADDLEKALNEARQRKIDDTLQYPANIPKTNAAQVVRHGDYVAFLLVGVSDPDLEEAQSEEAKKYAEDQVQKAVDAFNSVFEA